MTKSYFEYQIINTILIIAFFILGIILGYNRAVSISTEDPLPQSMPSAVPHAHERRDVGLPYPTLTLAAVPDKKMGWNLTLNTEHFTFTPERVNSAHQDGEGHAHLYLNGERVTRLYSTSYYLKELPPGVHTLTVTLSGNDHSELYANNVQIMASVQITSPH